MAKMANWGEINAKIGSTIGSPANRCPTKAMIAATGKAVVTSGYASNQLVPISAVSAAVVLETNTIRLSATMNNGSGMITVSAYTSQRVASNLTIRGDVIVEPSGHSRDFVITLLSGYQAGSTTVNVSVLEESVSIGFAYIDLVQDNTYYYELLY